MEKKISLEGLFEYGRYGRYGVVDIWKKFLTAEQQILLRMPCGLRKFYGRQISALFDEETEDKFKGVNDESVPSIFYRWNMIRFNGEESDVTPVPIYACCFLDLPRLYRRVVGGLYDRLCSHFGETYLSDRTFLNAQQKIVTLAVDDLEAINLDYFLAHIDELKGINLALDMEYGGKGMVEAQRDEKRIIIGGSYKEECRDPIEWANVLIHEPIHFLEAVSAYEIVKLFDKHPRFKITSELAQDKKPLFHLTWEDTISGHRSRYWHFAEFMSGLIIARRPELIDRLKSYRDRLLEAIDSGETYAEIPWKGF